MTPSRRALGAVLVVVALVAPLSACGSTGVDGAASTSVVDPGPTVVPTPTPTPLATISDVALKALVRRGTLRIAAASRQFHKCDHTVYDGGPSPCLDYVARETQAVTSLLGDITSVEHPKTYLQTIKDLKVMAKAGDQVARNCAVTNDQRCDTTLARFRADEQSVLWDLEGGF
jgi:hypothetical protein